jgi:energy-coupling factor transporter ATP-binding protein EcfA2
MANGALGVKISNVKGIKHLEAELPLSPGLYAITGKNGSGKSTLMAAIANLFFREVLSRFFGTARTAGSIRYQLGEDSLTWHYDGAHWKREDTGTGVFINGFYEGSIIHGNRFRDTNYTALFNASRVKKEDLVESDRFVREHLGRILHNDPEYYRNLYRLKSTDAYKTLRFRGSPYFVVSEDGQIISQFSMSTGESLLISLLHSLNYKVEKRTKIRDVLVVLLDEIELALHPSALIRLVKFLKDFSKHKRIAVYFSTHSIELLREISPDNIFYLQKHADSSVEVINPCYPAYATRNIYTHDGFDFLILTEDELSRKIVDWVITKNGLRASRLIHIIPVGGWEKVVTMHQEICSWNILGTGKGVLSVLDGDVEDEFKKKYLSRNLHRNLNVLFLPIKSAEKYLKNKLIDNVDYSFFRNFGDTFFRVRSLEEVLDDYRSKRLDDSNGKILLRKLKSELNSYGVSDDEFYSHLTEYIVSHENMNPLLERLKRSLDTQLMTPVSSR